MDNFDQATLRRFTFKIGFDYLTRSQVAAAFTAFFKAAAPQTTLALTNLTPADFAVPARKAEVLGFTKDISTLARLLEEEALAKEGVVRRIGFEA